MQQICMNWTLQTWKLLSVYYYCWSYFTIYAFPMWQTTDLTYTKEGFIVAIELQWIARSHLSTMETYARDFMNTHKWYTYKERNIYKDNYTLEVCLFRKSPASPSAFRFRVSRPPCTDKTPLHSIDLSTYLHWENPLHGNTIKKIMNKQRRNDSHWQWDFF